MSITKISPAPASDTIGSQSTANSTTTPLSGAATFTGTGEQSFFPDVGVSCYSDVAGTLYFDFSIDGTNWRTFPSDGFAVSAGIHEFHTAVKLGRYFRVRFANGSAAQATFQLSTYFGAFRQPSAPLNQPLSLDSDAILVRPTFPWLDISRGLSSGIETIKKFGRATVGTTYTPLCFGGNGNTGGIYQTVQSGSATALRVAAGNTNDTAAGSGAREVTLEGLDENFDFASEAVATAGTSASSATTTTFTRLFRAYVSKSGTYATTSSGSQAAEIKIENGAGGTTWGYIPYPTSAFPESQSSIGAYSVPTGKTAYVFLNDITVDSGKTADATFFHRGGADETAAPYTAIRAKSVLKGLTGGTTDLSGRNVPFGPFVGPCDIGFMGRVSATTGSIACEFEIYVVDE